MMQCRLKTYSSKSENPLAWPALYSKTKPYMYRDKIVERLCQEFIGERGSYGAFERRLYMRSSFRKNIPSVKKDLECLFFSSASCVKTDFDAKGTCQKPAF